MAVAVAVTGSMASAAEGFIDSFDDVGFRDRWFFANYELKGDHFPTGWRRKHVSLVLQSVPSNGGGALRMRLQESPDGEKAYLGAEVQRGGEHHYGVYEVMMRPAPVSGTVSAFFIYTGPYFDDPHDEIDLEFLGQDTTKVWVNRFSDGERMPGKWIDLPFDASKQLATYRIEWLEDSITWWVNDIELHRITSETHEIPDTPGRLMLNIWTGNSNQVEWLGRPEEGIDTEMLVHCVSYRPPGDLGLTCSEYGTGRW